MGTIAHKTPIEKETNTFFRGLISRPPVSVVKLYQNRAILSCLYLNYSLYILFLNYDIKLHKNVFVRNIFKYYVIILVNQRIKCLDHFNSEIGSRTCIPWLDSQAVVKHIDRKTSKRTTRQKFFL